MIPLRRNIAILLALVVGGALSGAAQMPAVVAVDDGTTVRGLAEYDGAGWAATCRVPARPDVNGARRPRVIATPGVAVVVVRTVPPAVAEWRQIQPLVQRLFDERARREGVSAATLARVPLSIDAMAATPASESEQVYYFRASKTVPDSRGDVDLDEDGDVDPKGDLRIDVSGFIHRGRALTAIGTNATLSWEQVEDRPEGNRTRRSELRPLGIVRLDGKMFWVMQGQAGESRWYALYDVGPGGVRMLVRSDARAC